MAKVQIIPRRSFFLGDMLLNESEVAVVEEADAGHLIKSGWVDLVEDGGGDGSKPVVVGELFGGLLRQRIAEAKQSANVLDGDDITILKRKSGGKKVPSKVSETDGQREGETDGQREGETDGQREGEGENV